MTRERIDYLKLHLQTVPAFRALLRGIECRLFAELGELDAPALDIGCGDGHFASLAFETSPPFVGLDLDQASIQEATLRQLYSYVLNANATVLPFAAASFATVISNCVIEHIPDLDSTLAEINRVLRPGGRFAFGVPSHRFAEFLLGSSLLSRLRMQRLADGYGRWFNNHARHYHLYSPEVWQDRLDTYGFEITSWQYYLSPAGQRAFDLAHYLGLPNLFSRRLTGRWTLWSPVSMRLLDCWLRPYYGETVLEQGACIFFDCRKYHDFFPNS